jgi:hypothetical protein
MTEHKLAWALRAVADDKDAMFTYSRGMAGSDPAPRTIEHVLNCPNLDWQLVPKPRKWQKEMDAFARGEAVQVKDSKGAWQHLISPAIWNCDEYRIKPQTVTKWLWADKYGSYTKHFHATQPSLDASLKLEWSATEFEVGE